MTPDELSLSTGTKIFLSLYKREKLIRALFYLLFFGMLPLLYFYRVFFWFHPLYLGSVIFFMFLLLLLGTIFPSKGWLRAKLSKKISHDIIDHVTLQGQIQSSSQLIRQLHIDKLLARDVKSTLRVDYNVERELRKRDRITEKILKTADKFGGILSLSKAFMKANAPMSDLRATFSHLKQQGVVEEIEQNIYDFHGMREFSQEDEKIITYAEEKGGQFNIEEAMKDFSWPRRKIEMKLEDLAQQGVTLKEVKHGTITWYFPGLIRKKGKITKEKEVRHEKSLFTTFQGEELPEELQRVIAQADDELLLSSYMFTDPWIGENKRFHDLLESKVKEGVDVTMILGKKPSEAVLQNLRGIKKIETFLCPRIHTKVILVDATDGLLLTGNLTAAGTGFTRQDMRNLEAATSIPVQTLKQEITKIINGAYCTEEKCKKYKENTCQGIKQLT